MHVSRFSLSRTLHVLALSFSVCGLSLSASQAYAQTKSSDPFGLESNITGGTRTVTDKDRDGFTTQELRIAPSGSIFGTSMVRYYPGSHQARLKAVGIYPYFEVTYFRTNGTRDCKLLLTALDTIVECFDRSGTRMLYRQQWDRDMSNVRPSESDSTSPRRYFLRTTTETNADGSPRRLYMFDFTYRLHVTAEYNVVKNGTFYGKVLSGYDNHEQLRRSAYLKRNGSLIKVVDAEPGIAAPTVPSWLLKSSEYLNRDDLPRPPAPNDIP